MTSRILSGALALLTLFAARPPVSQAAEFNRKICSWNAYSKQFIDAPVFKLLPIAGTQTYRAIITQKDREWRLQSKRPEIALAEVWNQLATKKFSIAFEWIDEKGKVIATEPAFEHVKAPDWNGFHEPRADWNGAAERAAAYLIDVAANGKASYREPGVPIWIWSSAAPCKEAPGGLNIGYPCLIVEPVAGAFMACAQSGSPHRSEGLRLARETAEWCLKNRHANSGALPLFPYSSIADGKFEGGVEGENVNLLRASFNALAFIYLYEGGQDDPRYLEYARHIANTTVKFQALDGSFPYRINPRTGAVADTYTPSAIEFALLIDALKPYGVSNELLMAQQRAVNWMLAYVMTTHHWQAVFEDVTEVRPYSDLSQFETQMFIRYLCKHRNEDPSYLPAAEAANRWVEDQFVIFGTGSESFDHEVKTPLVFEQYECWYPMEAHTSHWLKTLLELHRATGKRVYLEKAMAAGNAICAQQYPNGSFSTFGARRCVNGKVTGDDPGGNWYNGNAVATEALYRLAMYSREHDERN